MVGEWPNNINGKGFHKFQGENFSQCFILLMALHYKMCVYKSFKGADFIILS